MNRGKYVLCGGVALLLLGLYGCSLLNSQESQCHARKSCPGGQSCDVNTATCQPGDMAFPGDLTIRDLGFPVPAGMAWVEGGTFQIGNTAATDPDSRSDEAPVTAVTVRSFFLDQTEVTVGAYRACVTAGACSVPNTTDDCNWTSALGDKENHPINCVDWNQATAFCAAAKPVKKRLPTEFEWEYAARGPGRSKYPWGNDVPADQLCWKRYVSVACDMGSCHLGTCDVKASPPTKLGSTALAGQSGLYGMAGNVWEWTSSCYVPYGSSPDLATQNCNIGYVVRGGSWGIDDPQVVRAAYRGSSGATPRDYILGFRCAQD